MAYNQDHTVNAQTWRCVHVWMRGLASNEKHAGNMFLDLHFNAITLTSLRKGVIQGSFSQKSWAVNDTFTARCEMN